MSCLGGSPSNRSFFWAHIAATVALYAGIEIIVTVATNRWWPRIMMWTVALGLTLAVGPPRVYFGEHSPIDVVSGFVVGVGYLGAATFMVWVPSVTSAAKVETLQPAHAAEFEAWPSAHCATGPSMQCARPR